MGHRKSGRRQRCTTLLLARRERFGHQNWLRIFLFALSVQWIQLIPALAIRVHHWSLDWGILHIFSPPNIENHKLDYSRRQPFFSSFGCVALTLPNRIRVRSDVFTANLLETFQLADASKCLIKYTFQLKWMGFDFFPAAAFVIWLLAAVGPLDMIYHQLWARKLSAANMSCPQCS